MTDVDTLSREGILRYLRHRELTVRVCETVGSTNTVLKELAAKGTPAGLALVAGEQTAGRGRLGRSFYSPAGSGLYLSLLLRPAIPAAGAVRLTACAAVAAAETVEELSGRSAGIKWVNDIVMDGRKICGILTETGLESDNTTVRWIVVGLGVNVRVPEGGFPEELRGVAGAAFGETEIPELRCRLAAGILDKLWEYAGDPASSAIVEAYRRRSILPGKEILIHTPGEEPENARAVGINDDCSLLVRLPDGSMRTLRSGEVSVRTVD